MISAKKFIASCTGYQALGTITAIVISYYI